MCVKDCEVACKLRSGQLVLNATCVHKVHWSFQGANNQYVFAIEVATTTNTKQATLQLNVLEVMPGQLQSHVSQYSGTDSVVWPVAVLLADYCGIGTIGHGKEVGCVHNN